MTLEFSLITLHSNVSIGLLAFGSYSTLTFETEVQGLTFSDKTVYWGKKALPVYTNRRGVGAKKYSGLPGPFAAQFPYRTSVLRWRKKFGRSQRAV